MRVAEYYTMRRAVQNSAPAPDDAAVSAMEIELRAALLATGIFHSVEVGRTDDQDRLIIAMVRFDPAVDAAEAALALARLWTKQVAYGFWRAQTIRVDKGHVELQGATRLSLEGHYATVHLIAQEAPAPALAAPRVLRPATGRPTPSLGIGQRPAVQPVHRARRTRWARQVS